MVLRNSYIEMIKPFIGKPIIKAITGIRRSGKSTLMQQLIALIVDSGVSEECIISINKELFEFDTIVTYKDLHEYISSRSNSSKTKYYVFIDEVHEIELWEKAVNSLLAQQNYDIYITGSNARLMSSELATLLSGRYVEFKMYTLSYSEFVQLIDSNIKLKKQESKFDLFLKYGGFPGIHHLEFEDNIIRQYLQSVYSTVLLKDVVVRYNIRDTAMLDLITKYIIDSCGNITTAKNISLFMKSQHRAVSVDTVLNYLHYCCNAMIMEQIRRFDIKGRRILETHEKYYMADVGFRYATIGYTPEALSGQLENIVLLELLGRGYTVSIGKIGEKEIDFIAQKGIEKTYIQVCSQLTDGKVIDREYSSLEDVNDHFPKIVMSLDKGFETSRNGIKWLNIEDFLLSKTILI